MLCFRITSESSNLSDPSNNPSKARQSNEKEQPPSADPPRCWLGARKRQLGPRNLIASRSAPSGWTRQEDEPAMYIDDMVARRRLVIFSRVDSTPRLSREENDYFVRILAFMSQFVGAVLSIEVQEAEAKLLALDISGCLIMHAFTTIGLIGGPSPFISLLLGKPPGPTLYHGMSRATRLKYDHFVTVARRYEEHPDRMPADPGLPTELDVVDGAPVPGPDRWALNQREFENVIELFFDGVSDRYQLTRQSATRSTSYAS